MRHEHFPDTHHNPSQNTIFGFWLYLMSDFIVFAALFAVYGVLRNNTFGGPSAHELLSIPYALLETVVLATSSFTCALAMLAASASNKNKMIAWYFITFVLGISFLSMVRLELVDLIHQGHNWTQNAFLSSYFTLMGLHAVHILIGLLFMCVFVVQAWCWDITPVIKRRMTCLSMFWFFSYIVWIFMYTIVYLIGAH